MMKRSSACIAGPDPEQEPDRRRVARSCLWCHRERRTEPDGVPRRGGRTPRRYRQPSGSHREARVVPAQPAGGLVREAGAHVDGDVQARRAPGDRMALQDDPALLRASGPQLDDARSRVRG